MKTKYSDFNVYLPSTPSSAPTAVESEVPIVNSEEQPGLADGAGISVEDRGTIRILIVDDDRTLREGCASVLQVEGYSVTTCGRGDEALDMVRRAQFDIVLVDLYMTPVPGLEILKAALDVRPGTIVRGDDRQSERRVEHRGASQRRVGLSAEAVFRNAPAGAARPSGARGARDPRRATRRRSSRGSATGTATSSRCSASSPAFRRVVDLARKVATDQRVGHASSAKAERARK